MMVLAISVTRIPAIARTKPELPALRPTPQSTQLDLGKPFHTRSPWRLVVTEGVPAKDYGDNDAPGALTLCLQKGSAETCLSDPVTPPLRARKSEDANAWEPHYLLTAKVVYPGGPERAPFLLLVTGSLYSGNGDQIISTQVLRYDAGRDEFRRILEKSTGHNNNQEIRFIAEGPLRGSVITAEPQQQPPYGYWIEVITLSSAGAYRQVLRYLSATRYNDGNPLAVIDAEMPTIQNRLGLWKPGEPLPTPSAANNSKPCIHPTLKRSVLWCE
ncbi:MAG: hypothetical protein ABIO49_00355 [Dokdonella sp.]